MSECSAGFAELPGSGPGPGAASGTGTPLAAPGPGPDPGFPAFESIFNSVLGTSEATRCAGAFPYPGAGDAVPATVPTGGHRHLTPPAATVRRLWTSFLRVPVAVPNTPPRIAAAGDMNPAAGSKDGLG